MITLFHLIRNKFMHVITYSPNFALPHFATRGIPKKKTPHTAQWKVTLLTFICCLFTPSGWSFFSFSLYTKYTLLHGLIFSFFLSMESVRECSSDGQTSLPACTLARRECTDQLTHQVSSEGQLPVSVYCRVGDDLSGHIR